MKIKCVDCGNVFDENKELCPRCGNPHSNSQKVNWKRQRKISMMVGLSSTLWYAFSVYMDRNSNE